MNEPANDPLTATLRTPSEPTADAPNHPPPVVPEHRLLRCIGQGAYGQVWLAQNAMGTYRAVKVVYRNSFQDEQPYEREFNGIQRFEPISRSHDGFVDILQVGRDDQAGYFYYVMELADDASASVAVEVTRLNSQSETSQSLLTSAATYSPKTLRSELQRRGRLPFDECLQLALSLNLTLGHLHRQGLIHRDIKPSNIIFVNGIPKLADVGLVTDLSEARTFVGTEGFIPPEGPNSIQADVFSLGKVLYEISMGKDRKQFPEPFTGLGEVENSSALAELNAVIVKACATDPRQRYQSTEEMHLDLALLHGGKSVRKKRALERRLALLTRLSSVAIATTALVVAGYFYQKHQTEKANRLAAELQITQGIHVMDKGDLAGSLLWFVKALEQARWTKEEIETHRFRLGAVLKHYPRLVQLISHERGPGRVAFSPDGRRMLTYFWTPHAQISDVATGEPIAVLRHSDVVWQAVFSADGTRVVTASGPQVATDEDQEGEARVWDAHTGQPISPPLPHAARAFCAAFSPDARRVITGSYDGTAQIWDAVSGEKLGPALKVGTWVKRVAFSPDGQRVIIAGKDRTVQIRDANSGEPVGPSLRHPREVYWADFSTDGHSVLTASGRMLYLWDILKGEQRLPPFEHTEVIERAMLSPDGAKILALGDGGSAQVWDATTGEKLPPPPKQESWLINADFSPDSRLVAVAAGDGMAQFFEADSGSLITSPVPHNGEVWGVQFHPDGRRVATANVEPLVRLWDIGSDHAPRLEFVHAGRLTWAGFSPDGRRILTASWDGTARLWDAATGKEVIPALEHRGFQNYGRPSFSRDGRRVSTAPTDNAVQVWDTDRGEPITQPLRHTNQVRNAVLSPDGKQIVTACYDGTVQLWDVNTGERIGPELPKFRGTADAAFSPGGRRLAIIGHAPRREFQAQVWDLATGEPVTPTMHGRNSTSYTISFSPDGNRLLVRRSNGEVHVWDAHSGQPITPVLTHDGSRIYAARFSPDSRRVVTTGGRMARLWDAATGKQLTRPLEHEKNVIHAAFSPDGRRIVTTSEDRTARLWDASTGLPLTPPLQHRDAVVYAEFSPDGRRVLTASADGTARVWEFESNTWPVEDLRLLAQLLSGRTIDPTGSFSSSPPATLKETLRKLKLKHAEYFGEGEKPLMNAN